MKAEHAAQIALVALSASVRLELERSKIYCDLVLSSLSDAVLQTLTIMDAYKYQYQSEFARRFIAEGIQRGEALGRAALIARQLTLRFGLLSAPVNERIQHASIAELDAMGERLLTAQSLSEVLAPP